MHASYHTIIEFTLVATKIAKPYGLTWTVELDCRGGAVVLRHRVAAVLLRYTAI